MIRSMTGFGHGEVSNDKNQKVTVEMKSVNHRYCDISLKLPKKLAMFEANIRNIMKEYASRGKIDIYVSYEDLSETAVSLHYNQAMAEEYMQVFKKMQEDFNIETKITAEALAKYPEVVTIEEVQQDHCGIQKQIRRKSERIFRRLNDRRKQDRSRGYIVCR